MKLEVEVGLRDQARERLEGEKVGKKRRSVKLRFWRHLQASYLG